MSKKFESKRFREHNARPFLILQESAAPIFAAEPGKDPTPNLNRKWKVRIIEEGLSANKKFYTANALKGAIAIFEGQPMGIYEFLSPEGAEYDHAPKWVRDQFPGGVAKNVCGYLKNVRVEEGESQRRPGTMVTCLVADAQITDPWLQATLSNSVPDGKDDLLQLSIEADGKTYTGIYEGQAIDYVDEITKAEELTVVTRAGAGGMFETRLIASDLTKIERLIASAPVTEESSTETPTKVENISVEKNSTEEGNSSTSTELTEQLVTEDLKKSENEGVQTNETVSPPVTETKVEKPVKETEPMLGKIRASLVRALRASGYSEPLEESSAEELLTSLESRVETLEEADRNELTEALALCKQEKFDEAGQKLEEGCASMKTRKAKMKEAADAAAQATTTTPPPVAPPAPVVTAPVVATLDPAIATQLAESFSAQVQGAVSQAMVPVRLAECERNLSTTLANAKNLTETAKAEILKKFTGRLYESRELLDAVDMCGKIIQPLVTRTASSGNSVDGYVGPRITMGADRVDKVKAEIDLIFEYDYENGTGKDGKALKESDKQMYRDLKRRGMPSIANVFKEWFDDPALNLNGAGPNSIYRELKESSLRESNSTADITKVLGDSITRVLLQAYGSAGYNWRSLAQVVPVRDFRTQRRILYGGLGYLPKVAENANYLTLGIPQDFEKTYAVDTRGGVIEFNRRMIINDDLDALRRLPAEAAEACNYTLQMVVMQAFIGNAGAGGVNTDLSYDGAVIYGTSHRNYSTSAFAYSSLIAARNQIKRQRRFGNVGTLTAAQNSTSDTNFTLVAGMQAKLKVGDEIMIDAEMLKVTAVTGTAPSTDITASRGYGGTTPATHANAAMVMQLGSPIAQGNILLVAPLELESNIDAVLMSGQVPGGMNNDNNFVKSRLNITPLIFDETYLSQDFNNWFLSTPNSLEVGFLQGRENPELILQNDPYHDDVFKFDEFKWKARHEYGVVLPDHRKVQGNFVT